MYKIPANLGFASNLVHYLPSCHSTNEVAAGLLANDLEEGTIIITDNQTDGKGQRGNGWVSAPNLNLTFSLILKPSFVAIAKQFLLTQVVSVSIAQVLQTYMAKQVKIKWPNDIYIGKEKIAGILIQNSVKGKEIENCIIGIGCNVNQLNFENLQATSIQKISGEPSDLNQVLTQLLESIYDNYTRLKLGLTKELEKEYLSILLGRNEVRSFIGHQKFEGRIIGADPLGRLLIETSDGVKSFQNQEIKFVL